MTIFNRLSLKEISEKRAKVLIDPKIRDISEGIINEIEKNGLSAILSYAKKFGDIKDENSNYFYSREELKTAWKQIEDDQKSLLERVSKRIRIFAKKQLDSLQKLSTNIPGGSAGHNIAPVNSAGCYAPGGRYPLISTVMMTVNVAKVAGVKNIIVSSPNPNILMMAAAYISGANFMLAFGGIQAIAAMAYGFESLNKVDIIVGPGNKYVTAAKSIISGRGLVAIDMLAGPSELLIIADEKADYKLIAADLIAQAEHDVDACPILACNSESIIKGVELEIENQLNLLPSSDNRNTAFESLTKSGYCIAYETINEAIDIANKIAPEHLELHIETPEKYSHCFINYGSIFIGSKSAEVFGDYGFGPNHTLPTNRTSCFSAGLSVFNFIRIRTFLKLENIQNNVFEDAAKDTIQLALLEGLNGHAKSAEMRLISRELKGQNEVELKDNKVERLIRKDFAFIEKYYPVKPLEVLAKELGYSVDSLCKLDANENLYGAPKEVIDDITKSYKLFHIYPDPSQSDLRMAISKHLSVSENKVVAGCGSDELLDLLFRVILPKNILISTPTFSMYKFLAKINQTEVVNVLRDEKFELKIDEIISYIKYKNISLVFIASPNNPTGNVVKKTEIKKICEEDCIVVVDEAYAEFSDSTMLELTNKYSNLVILRTFSKFAGLAGLRIGYGIMNEKLASCLMQIKQPYNINVAANVAAQSALKNFELINKTIYKIKLERLRLFTRLEEISQLSPCPSQANFILCKVHNGSAKDLQLYLRKLGILIRCYAGQSQPILDDYIRISIGRPKDTDILLRALKKYEKTPKLVRNISNFNYRPLAIVFDMDGVLVDVSKSYRESIRLTLEYFNLNLSSTQIDNYKMAPNSNNDQLVTYNILKSFGHNVTYQKVKEKFQEFYLGVDGLQKKEKAIFPTAFLKKFSKLTNISIATGRPYLEAKQFLESENIFDLFKSITTMEDGPAKPDPTILLLAIEKMGLDLNNADSTKEICIYFIGDSPDDMQAAKKASQQLDGHINIIPIGFIPTVKSPENFNIEANLFKHGAERIFYTVEELNIFITNIC